MGYTFDKTIEATFDEAKERVVARLADAGFGVLTEIDVKATMKKKLDEDLPPYTILGACHPPSAFRALSAEPHIGAMLPCNVIVRDVGEGSVQVSAVDPVASMQAVDNAALGEVAQEVQAALRGVIDAL